jgi:hypothetical protein
MKLAVAAVLVVAFGVYKFVVPAVRELRDTSEAVYRLFDREQQLFRAFAIEVASGSSTWGAAARFGTGFKASNRRYATEILACAAHASPEERPSLERTLHDF